MIIGRIYRPLGYKRVYLPLCRVADTNSFFQIQIHFKFKFIYSCSNYNFYICLSRHIFLNNEYKGDTQKALLKAASMRAT